MEPISILAIDDAEDQLELLKVFMSEIDDVPHRLYVADRPEEGLELLKKNQIDLVITDYMMPNMNGLDVLKFVRNLNPSIKVVIMTASTDISEAVVLMKQGAYDYLLKPIKHTVIHELVQRVSENLHIQSENKVLRSPKIDVPKTSLIIYKSPEMEKVLNIAVRAAGSNSTVLVRGESGTGKELVAQLIHQLSARQQQPFVVVNIAALPGTLIESELFGHKKGSFTGAVQDRMGRFEEAHGGTLFIDELGEIDLSAQVKLLRAVQFGKVERVGDNKTIETDTRIIAATNQDLEKKIRDKSFREDLYYRLNVITIWIPPLRERRTDIPMLIDHFLKTNSEMLGKTEFRLSKEAFDSLMKYDYPGNVRELENILERACVLCRGQNITRQDIMLDTSNPQNVLPFNPHDLSGGYEQKMHDFEREMIRTALNYADGNKSKAARMLGISERKLRSRLERIEID
ncbi:MAG: sigma-54-dependent Fis family transcriptional regulator [Spirochaetales bacterium]|nr:sigma-54-dependent Fis family transcriptional regulator [Spirochaetales bacterium]